MSEDALKPAGGTLEPPRANEGDAEPSEQELRAILARRTTGGQAMRQAVGLAFRTATVGVPTVLLFAGIGTAVYALVLRATLAALEADPITREVAVQMLGAGGVFATVYAVIQFTKRDRASRASWAPALFAVPLLAAAVGLGILHTSPQASQIKPMALSLPLTGWVLLWYCFGGAAAVIAWLLPAKAVLDGRRIDVFDVLHQVRTRFVEIAGPRGARVHAVTIGLQFVLPGVFYALQLAFTEMIAVLDPERPALQRSGQLTSGMRGRLFRMMAVWALVTHGASIAGALAIEAVEAGVEFEALDADGNGALDVDEAAASPRLAGKFRAIDVDHRGTLSPDELAEWREDNDVTTVAGAMGRAVEMLLDPASVSGRVTFAMEVIKGVGLWILMLALLVLYLERENQVKAKTALKKRAAAG